MLLSRIPKTVVNIGNNITAVSEVRSLGVIFENKLNMQSHIRNVSPTAMYHLYNISRIKRHLGQSAIELIIHALVTSRIDYCNSVCIGLLASALAPLQRVQNAAARLLTK